MTSFLRRAGTYNRRRRHDALSISTYLYTTRNFGTSRKHSHIIPYSPHIEPHQQPRVGVACAVFPSLGNKVIDTTHVLMIQRKTEPAKNQWSLPGGRLQFGETIADCAIRETEEETGLKATIANPVVPSYACTDAIYSMYRDPISVPTDTVIAYHYTVVHTLGFTQPVEHNHNGQLVLPTIKANDDALNAMWISLGTDPHPAVYYAGNNFSLPQPILSLQQLAKNNQLVTPSQEILAIAQQIWQIYEFIPLQHKVK